MTIAGGFRAAATAAALAAALPAAAFAQNDIRTERVQFARGASSATIEGKITGYEIIDYVVNAREGQSANISMATRHGATYFNVMAPGETEAAFFVGSTSGNQYEGTLPASGDFHIRVYMMRSAARRNETASYRLEISITGAASRTGAPAGDAKVAGTDFHATGNIPCSMGSGQPTTQCRFGVRREGDGNGSVFVTTPDGGTRVILFERGEAAGYDASKGGGTGAFRATRDGDLTTVHIGNERYEIPDAVVLGG